MGSALGAPPTARPYPAPRSDASGAPPGSSRQSPESSLVDDAAAPASGRPNPQDPLHDNAQATCSQCADSLRSVGKPLQTPLPLPNPPIQSASARPPHRSPSIPSARSSSPIS